MTVSRLARRSAVLVMLLMLLATETLFLVLDRSSDAWDGPSVPAVEPENDRFTQITLDLVRDREVVVTGEVVLLLSHYVADKELTVGSRAPCASRGCDCRYYVVILGGDFDARRLFGSGLSPVTSEPIAAKYAIFTYEFDHRGRLLTSGITSDQDGSIVEPLIYAAAEEAGSTPRAVGPGVEAFKACT